MINFDRCEEIAAPPCGVVIFGASGDLTNRKLIPSLFLLFRNKLLPETFYILGCARTEMTDAQFRTLIEQDLKAKFEECCSDLIEPFLNRCFYLHGDYDDIVLYKNIIIRTDELSRKFKTKGNKLFYCATPPQVYTHIIEKLSDSGITELSATKSPWVRVIVEKPFGYDLKSSRELNNLLTQNLDEHQIYRIDHYLGKETVQNILMLRFANAIFEPLWNNKYIDHVQITTSESIGIEHRAGYFEKAGLFRDMFQNHMLQLLTLVTMEPPARFDADQLRDEKTKVLRAISPLNEEKLRHNFVRAQYTANEINGEILKSYREEKNVNEHSLTETFVAMKLSIDNWRWRGVPFYFRVGKRLKEKTTQIAIIFKSVPHSIFKGGHLPANVLILQVQPKESLSIKFMVKQPGTKSCLTPVDMKFGYKDAFSIDLPDAYERLLLDCMNGDQTLFIRDDFMDLAWKLIMPVLNDWSSETPINQLKYYKAGTWGPLEAQKLIQKDGRNWLNSGEDYDTSYT